MLLITLFNIASLLATDPHGPSPASQWKDASPLTARLCVYVFALLWDLNVINEAHSSPLLAYLMTAVHRHHKFHDRQNESASDG